MARADVPARVTWSVSVLDPRPDERLLEIGCGPGVAADLVCARLTTGHLLAVDRSATAVQRTARRCAEHLASGRLSVRQVPLAALDVPPASVDQAFAIDVNLFWVAEAHRELEVLTRALRPRGRLLLLYGSGGPTSADRVTGPVARSLRDHGFTDVTTVTATAGTGVLGRRAALPTSQG